VTSLVAVEDQVRQERSVHQQAENQLQQERSALKEAQAALECERLTREEAQGQLQREHTALEEVGGTLKLRDAEITRLTGELRWAGEEKDAAIVKLQQAAKTARATLETEKKHVEGKLSLSLFACWLSLLRSTLDLFCVFAFRPTDGSWDVGDVGRDAAGGL
jgi:ATP/maltotriose-dependent transcriptional regulator MalT